MARSRKAGVMSQTVSSDGPRSRLSMEINDNAPWMNPSEVNGGGMGTGEKMARHKQKRSTNSCAKEMNQAHPLAATICFQVVTTVMTATRALKVESDRVNSNQRRSNTRHFTMPPLASAGWSREIPATGPTKFPRNSRDRMQGMRFQCGCSSRMHGTKLLGIFKTAHCLSRATPH